MGGSRILLACVLASMVTQIFGQCLLSKPRATHYGPCGCEKDCHHTRGVHCYKPPEYTNSSSVCACARGWSRYPNLDDFTDNPGCIRSQAPAIPHGGVCTRRLTCLPEFNCSVDNWLDGGPSGKCICNPGNPDKRFYNEDEEICQKYEPRNHGQGCKDGQHLCYTTRKLVCRSGKCACKDTNLHWNVRNRMCDTGLYGKTCTADTECEAVPPAATSFLKCMDEKCACDIPPGPSQWNERDQKCEGGYGDACTAGSGSGCSANLTLTCITPTGGTEQCGCEAAKPYWHNVVKQCLDKEYGYGNPCTTPAIPNGTEPGCWLGFDCNQHLSRCECTRDSFWHPGLPVPKCLDMSYGINDPCSSDDMTKEGSCYPGLTCDNSSPRKCVCSPATPHYHDVEMKCLGTTHGAGDPCGGHPGCYSTLTCNKETKMCECTNPGQFYHNQKYKCLDDSYASTDPCDPSDRTSCYLTLECKPNTMTCACVSTLPHWHDVKRACLDKSYSFTDACDAVNTCYATLSCVNGKCACTAPTPNWNNDINKCTARKFNRRGGAENLKPFCWPIFLGILMTVFNTFGTMIPNEFHK